MIDWKTVILSMVTSSVFATLVSFGLQTYIGARHLRELDREFDREMERYKQELSLTYNQQVKRRQLYDDCSEAIEQIFGEGVAKTEAGLSLQLNRLFGKLALYAPDSVYLTLKGALIDQGPVFGKDVKPQIYHALRTSLLGDETRMTPADFVPHINATPIPSAIKP